MTRLMRREMRTVCNIDYSKPKREKRKKQSRESAVRRKKKTQQRCNGDHEKQVSDSNAITDRWGHWGIK